MVLYSVGMCKCNTGMIQFALCVFCSAAPRRRYPICSNCAGKLEELYLPMKQICTDQWGFPLLSLFDWQDDKLALPRLVMALKQGAHPSLWDFLADIFVDQLGSFRVQLNNPLFVPIPSRMSATKDHAYLWAQSLSQRLGGEVRLLLRRADSTQQKRKSREERTHIQFERVGELGNSFRTVVMVDDLVASGATMRAAIATFPAEKEALGFSLVRRSLL